MALFRLKKEMKYIKSDMGVTFVYTNKDKGRRAPIFPFSLSAEKRNPFLC